MQFLHGSESESLPTNLSGFKGKERRSSPTPVGVGATGELRTGEGGHGEEKTTSAATPEEQENSSLDSKETAGESLEDEGTLKKELRTGEGGHGEEKTTPEEQKNSSVDSEETAEESRAREGSTSKEYMYTTSPLAPAEYDDSFSREPFPCEQKGCKVFHGDQSTGLCPAHGGGGGGSSESRDEDEEQPGGCSSAIAVCIPPRSVLEHRFELSIKFGTIFLLTAGMAVLDTDNRTVIAGLFGSAFVMMCLNILGADPDAGRIVGLVFFILAAIVLAKKMADTVVVLEGMEGCWKAYDDEYNAEIEKARRKYGGEIPPMPTDLNPSFRRGSDNRSWTSDNCTS